MIEAEADLFGMPTISAQASQWFTPPWLARLMARWVPASARVLEPCAGAGNLVDALIRGGHAPSRITAIELDPRWHAWLLNKYGDTLGALLNGNFLARPFPRDFFDVVFMNPPYEENEHLKFVLHALELAPIVIGVFPITFEYTNARETSLWATKGKVTRRAKLPERVDFGGTETAMGEHEVLQIERRTCVRMPWEVTAVLEETWLRSLPLPSVGES